MGTACAIAFERRHRDQEIPGKTRSYHCRGQSQGLWSKSAVGIFPHDRISGNQSGCALAAQIDHVRSEVRRLRQAVENFSSKTLRRVRRASPAIKMAPGYNRAPFLIDKAKTETTPTCAAP